MIYLIIFIGFLGYSLMITIFTPLLLASHYEHKTILLGLLLSLYPLGQFFGSPCLGYLSDRFGRRIVLVVSLVLAMLFYFAVAGSLEGKSLVLLMISSLILGFVEGNIVLAQGIISDVYPKEERGKYFGYIYLWVSMAYIVGPLFGGQVAARLGSAAPFWIVGLLLGFLSLYAYFRFRETHEGTEGHFQIFSHLFMPEYRRYYFINFLLYLGIFGFFRVYPMFLVKTYNYDVAQISYYIAWVAVPLVLANMGLNGYLGRHFSAKRLTIVSAFFFALFMCLIPFLNPWISLFLTSAGLAICLPNCAALLSHQAPQAVQGQVMGNNQSLQVGAEALSGFVGGVLAAIVISLPLFALALVVGIGLVMLYKH